MDNFDLKKFLVENKLTRVTSEATTTTNDIVFEFEEIIESQEGDFEGTGALASYTCPRFPSLELIVDGNIDGTGFFQPIGIVELKKA
jgi:hypothetical protein